MTKNLRKKLARLLVILASFFYGILILDILYPLNLERYEKLSTEILDKDGNILRHYLSADGFFRLKTSVDDVDDKYLKMLIAYEDKRFYSHRGVDPLALGRAFIQFIQNGKAISGASTLTMQAAKLLEPRRRNIISKTVEIFRSFQLEQRFTKKEILNIYLTLAPFGSNKEGVRAAAYYYFGREPDFLTASEAALLVSLPQSPTKNRPDRFPKKAQKNRDKILRRIAKLDIFKKDVLQTAFKDSVKVRTHALALNAPHFSNFLKARNSQLKIKTPIDKSLQIWSEQLAKNYVKNLPKFSNAAILIIENNSRNIISYVGSAEYQNSEILGYVDMVKAVRSPGSTLKPFIYAEAIERAMAHPNSLINDIPTNFGNYQPENFNQKHYGDLTLEEALQKSLNIPAVIALERIGPVRFTEKMSRLGLRLKLPNAGTSPAGLAIALGGVGVTLADLTMAYSALASDGRFEALKFEIKNQKKQELIKPAFRASVLWHMAKMLRGVHAPFGQVIENRSDTKRIISYKTGTSYGYRDAWAVGYSDEYTVGIWIGRTDGAPNLDQYGAIAAAPLLFKIFERLNPKMQAHNIKPKEALDLENNDLPPHLKRFERFMKKDTWADNTPPPEIIFPLHRSIIQLPEDNNPLVLEASGGKKPFIWIINGKIKKVPRYATKISWLPDGEGFSEIILVDALGRKAKSYIKLIP